MQMEKGIPNVVAGYYDAHAMAEHKRLDLALCRIEFLSTLHLIDRYFPRQGSACDIGGATGRYSLEPLRRGYQCVLRDISVNEIAIAKTILAQNGFNAACAEQGDATDLSQLAAQQFDAGLLLGPMYHLSQVQDRKRALGEFHRVLKYGAIGLIAFINTWGLLRTGINDFPTWYKTPGFAASLLKPRSFSAPELSGFTECFWTTPIEASQELSAAGFTLISYAGVESFAAGMNTELTILKREDRVNYERIA